LLQANPEHQVEFPDNSPSIQGTKKEEKNSFDEIVLVEGEESPQQG
jgi:hypothetical protein